MARWREWARANLLPTDAVVIEATTNAWAIYDLLLTLVGRAVVTHPAKVKLIADARVKTDNVDVLILAQLLRADMLPEVWVPPPHVRDLRAALPPPPARSDAQWARWRWLTLGKEHTTETNGKWGKKARDSLLTLQPIGGRQQGDGLLDAGFL